jgi:hypothetical protein
VVMSGNYLWDPAMELDKSSSRDLTQDRTERPDMSGLGAEHIRETSLEPG